MESQIQVDVTKYCIDKIIKKNFFNNIMHIMLAFSKKCYYAVTYYFIQNHFAFFIINKIYNLFFLRSCTII